MVVGDGEESVVGVGEFGVVPCHELGENGAFPVPSCVALGFAVGAVPILLSRDRACAGSVVTCTCAADVV